MARAELNKQGSGLPHTKSGGFLGLVDRLTSGIIGRSGSGAKQAADAAQVCLLWPPTGHLAAPSSQS